MPILSRNIDNNCQKQSFRLPFVATLATNGNQKHCFYRFFDPCSSIVDNKRFRLPPTRCGTQKNRVNETVLLSTQNICKN